MAKDIVSIRSGARHREKQKAETRALILNSARNLFEAMGFEKTTMRAIAESMEMGYGTIFKHFTNKHELLAACLHEEIEAALNEAIKTLPNSPGLQVQFMHIARRLIDHYAQRPDLSRTLIEHIVFVDGSWKTTMDSQVERFLQVLETLIQTAKNRAEVRPEIDNRLLAFSFFSTYLSTLAFSLRAPGFDPEQTIRTLNLLVGLHLRGALTHPEV